VPNSFLEKIAIAGCCASKSAGRHTHRAPERIHEIAEVAEADIQGHIGDRTLLVCQQPGGVA
jgi:hypothetical protein